MNRKLNGVVAGSLLFLGCSNPETEPSTPPPSTIELVGETVVAITTIDQDPFTTPDAGVEQLTLQESGDYKLLPNVPSPLEVGHVSAHFIESNDTLSNFLPEVTERYIFDNEVFDFYTTEELADYRDLVISAIPFLSSLDEAFDTYSISDIDTGISIRNIKVDASLRHDAVSTFVLLPREDLPEDEIIAGLTSVRYFRTPEGELLYTRSATVVTEAKEDAEDGLLYLDRDAGFAIVTELMQSLYSVKLLDYVGSDEEAIPLLLAGQESLANSVGRMYFAARNGFSYEQYVESFTGNMLRNNASGLAVPVVVFDQDIYDSMVEFSLSLPAHIQ